MDRVRRFWVKQAFNMRGNLCVWRCLTEGGGGLGGGEDCSPLCDVQQSMDVGMFRADDRLDRGVGTCKGMRVVEGF